MSDLSQILADTAERLLADHVTKEVLLEAEQGAWPDALWLALEDNGLTQLLVPEGMGGVGAGWGDAFVIVFAAGRHRAPVPLAETIAAGWLMSHFGLDVPAGPMTLIDDGHGLQRSGAGVSGQASAVPWGRGGGSAVANLWDGEHWQIVQLMADDTTVVLDTSIANEPRDHMTVDSTRPEPLAALPVKSEIAPVRLLGALFRSAQIAGGLGRAVELAVSYVTERQQFGRPLAKFQAIQQMLAVAAARAAEARMAAEMAFTAMQRTGGDLAQADLDIASAKIVCGEAVEIVTDITHQAHGAIGFTHEHELHFTTRRLWSWRAEFGAESFWAQHLGEAVLSRGANNLWPDLTARQACD